jgi:hypothetical protein
MITSKDTSVNQLPAIALCVERIDGWFKGSTNLDIGAGKYDQLTEYLHKRGIQSFPYDPYNRTKEENDLALASGPYDTVTVSNVLNVLDGSMKRTKALHLVRCMLKPDGIAYFTVYEGDKTGIGKLTLKGWQENRRTKLYVEEIKKVFEVVQQKGKLIIGRVAERQTPGP